MKQKTETSKSELDRTVAETDKQNIDETQDLKKLQNQVFP